MKKNKRRFRGRIAASTVDGTVIMPDALKKNDGKIVPLVLQSKNNEPPVVIGTAVLEYREDGLYAVGTLTDLKKEKDV